MSEGRAADGRDATDRKSAVDPADSYPHAGAARGRAGTAVILVPHEPQLDPRVEYTTRALESRYRIVLLSVVRDFERRSPRPIASEPDTHIERIPYSEGGLMQAAWELVGLSLRGARNRPLTFVKRVLGVIGIGLAAPILSAGLSLWRKYQVNGARMRRFLRPVFPRGGAVHQMVMRLEGAVGGIGFVGGLGGLRVLASVGVYTLRVSHLLERRWHEMGVQPDVIYCHDLYALQAGVSMKRRTGARLVYDSHEFYPFQYEQYPYPQVVRWYEALLVSEVDVYITVSDPLARALEDYYAFRPVHVVPNVEERPAGRVVPVQTAMTALAVGRLKVLYQGSFAPNRGLEEVLEEWRAVDPSAAALFLRGPPNAWRDGLVELARRHGLLDRCVYILEPVTEEELIAAAAEADVGIIPYKGDSPAYRYACPNKLSQYLHAGVAVVANRIPYVETLVKEGRFGSCYDVGTPGSFTGVIVAFAGDPSGLAEAKCNARRFAADVFHWQNFEEDFLGWVAGGPTGDNGGWASL